MPRRGLLLLAAVGMIVIPAAAPAAPPRESVGIRVLGRGPYLVLRMEPGSTAVREVAVSSTVSRPIEVPLLPVNARTVSGEFQTIDQAPDWLAVHPSILHFDAVPVGQVIEEAATVTITVPSDARPASIQAAVLAVAPPSQGGSVRVVNRVGLRVYLTILGPSFPWLAMAALLGLGLALGGVLWGLSKRRTPGWHSRRNVRSPLPRAHLRT